MKTNSSPGEPSKNITANSTMNLWLDCGSHCQEYGAEPGSGEGDSIEFCDVTDVQQPNKRQGCPMEKGGAILSYEFFVWDMFLHQPVSQPTFRCSSGENGHWLVWGWKYADPFSCGITSHLICGRKRGKGCSALLQKSA